MIDKIEEKWSQVVSGSPAIRMAICEQEPALFAAYYFPEYFTYNIPKFHYDLYSDCRALNDGTIDEAMWIVFRDGAKTSIAKIALACWVICYRKKSYIGWDSYDGSNSESALFDLTVALQTNKRIINDFGHLYYKKKQRDAYSEAKMKRIKDFITEKSARGAGVKVIALTTQEPIRGRIKAHERLDLIIFDDFENNITKESRPITQKVINHINEYRSGMPAGASVLYLCNYLSESGSVAWLRETLKNNPRGRIRFVPIKDEKGRIAWPDKYVETDRQAEEINKTIPDIKKHKISLESRKRSLSKDGLLFEVEMMLDPSRTSEAFFDRPTIDRMIKLAVNPLEEKAGFRIYSKFSPAHRFAGGADVAAGIGKDSSASAFIDFSTTPNRLAACFDSSTIAPDVFAHELKREGDMYGTCLLAPESNSEYGGSCINELKRIYPIDKIYRNTPQGILKAKVMPGNKLGFETNSATKPDALFQYKRAIEDGILDVKDLRLLKEMRSFTNSDLQEVSVDPDTTRHFDLLMAAAIAWVMRHYAEVPTKSTPYQQPDAESSSPF